MIHVRTLGATDVRTSQGDEVRTVLAQPKRLALLAYLAVARPRGFHSKDTLRALFWPEADDHHARRALNRAVYFLRHALGDDSLVGGRGDSVSVSRDALWCDAVAFEESLDAGRVEEALELYSGDFLTGFFTSAAPEFDQWLDHEREHLRKRAMEAALSLADRELARGNVPSAARWAARASEVRPYAEGALRRLLTLLDRAGDRGEAVRTYREFAHRLQSELGVEPSPETQSLVEAIRARVGLAGTGSDTGDRTGAEPSLATIVTGRVRTPRVGRSRVLALAAVALLLAGAWTVIGSDADRMPALDLDLVAVAPFDLLTDGQELWREGLVDVLSRYLDGAGPLRMVSPTVAIRRWRGRADPASAADLGRRTRARFVVFGDLVSAGPDSVRVSLSILDVATGRRIALAGIRDVRVRMDRVADSAAVAVLRELGRIRPIGAVRNASLAATSPEALKAFLLGEQFYRKAEWDSAIAHYERALDLDSSFVVALWHLGRAHFWRGHRASHAHVRRAAALNRGLAPRESLLIVADSLFVSLSTLPLGDYGWAQRARRLFAILQNAAERDRDDPEVWQALGEARVHFWVMPGNRGRERLALDAFDRAIALDAAFGATYRHAIQLTMRDAGAGAARRYTRAYEALRPRHAVIDGTTLLGRLVDGPVASVIDTLVANAPLQALEEALVFGLLFWPDSAETGVHVARAWRARVRDTADSVRARRLLAIALAYRGHLREAFSNANATDPLIHELALLGVVPGDSGLRVLRDWLAELASRGDTLQFSRKSYSLERSPLPLWMAARRDTAQLRQYLRTVETLRRAAPSGLAGASMEYFAAAGRAYLALGRGDTAQALRRLGTLPDSLCPVCDLEQLVRSQLLTAHGRYPEAHVLLERDYNATSSPLRGLWQLQRARVAERLGEDDEAIGFYAHVTELWRHADRELEPFVAEATLGLRRLRKNASH